ncbi:membrane protein [Francisella tularensis subsp. tularensis 79201237]|nr:membrane protein [Francisella tularensis subsp. tularensis 79201237]
MKDYQSLIEQINNIENTLKASGRYVFNSKKLIVAGVMFLLIPIIQYLINISFWKNSFINNYIEIGIFINIVFYIVFFKLVFRITRSSKKISISSLY